MIILDGNVFFAQVKYDRIDQTIILVWLKSKPVIASYYQGGRVIAN
jgi:hypothetical protein